MISWWTVTLLDKRSAAHLDLLVTDLILFKKKLLSIFFKVDLEWSWTKLMVLYFTCCAVICSAVWCSGITVFDVTLLCGVVCKVKLGSRLKQQSDSGCSVFYEPRRSTSLQRRFFFFQTKSENSRSQEKSTFVHWDSCAYLGVGGFTRVPVSYMCIFKWGISLRLTYTCIHQYSYCTTDHILEPKTRIILDGTDFFFSSAAHVFRLNESYGEIRLAMDEELMYVWNMLSLFRSLSLTNRQSSAHRSSTK